MAMRSVGLGSQAAGEVYNEAKGIYEYSKGDNSLLILLFGVITLFVIAAFIVLWVLQIRQSYKAQRLIEEGKHVPTFVEDLKSLKEGNLHITLMTLPCLGILVFNIVPLVFMISMAFTSWVAVTKVQAEIIRSKSGVDYRYPG